MCILARISYRKWVSAAQLQWGGLEPSTPGGIQMSDDIRLGSLQKHHHRHRQQQMMMINCKKDELEPHVVRSNTTTSPVTGNTL